MDDYDCIRVHCSSKFKLIYKSVSSFSIYNHLLKFIVILLDLFVVGQHAGAAPGSLVQS